MPWGRSGVLLAQHLPQRRMLVLYAALLVLGSVLAAAAPDARCAAPHRRPRRLPQTGQHPAIARRPHPHQMRRDLTRRSPIGVQHPGGCAMQHVARIACTRALDRVADDRVNEPRRIIGPQHLQSHQARTPRDGLGHLHTGQPRRVAQLAAVTEHRECLRHGNAPGCRPRTPASTRCATPHPRQPAARLIRTRPAGEPLTRSRSSSERYRGLPPLAAHAAAHSSSVAPGPSEPRTIASTAPRSTAPGAAALPAPQPAAPQATSIDAGTAGRGATSSATAGPSSRGAR